jgi:hypothetical protein
MEFLSVGFSGADGVDNHFPRLRVIRSKPISISPFYSLILKHLPTRSLHAPVIIGQGRYVSFKPTLWRPARGRRNSPSRPSSRALWERLRTKLPNKAIFPPNPNKMRPLAPLATEADSASPVYPGAHPLKPPRKNPSRAPSPAYSVRYNDLLLPAPIGAFPNRSRLQVRRWSGRWSRASTVSLKGTAS